MYKNVLQAITGIEIYPMISFAIFFVFFLGLLVYVALVKREHISILSNIPLQNDTDNATSEGGLL